MTGAGRGPAAAWLLAAALLLPAPAAAHPLGNFSISHYAALEVGADAVVVRYVLDMAEIPTFQEIQEHGLVAEPGHPTAAAWLARSAAALGQGLRLTVDGRALALVPERTEIIFPPGAGGLPTLKAAVHYRAALDGPDPGVRELRYADENFPDRIGWKEIVVRAGPGVRLLSSTAPATDRSGGLSDYPADLLDSPPQDLRARVTFARDGGAPALARPPATPGSPTPGPAPPAGLRPNRQAPGGSALADLVTGSEPGTGVVALALLVAVALGAFHALEPGHGKTVVAAYLVGARGTVRHALLLGLIVTVSHTAGVYLLGGVTFFASQHVVPERLYPWLSLTSGLTIAGLGAALFLRRYAGRERAHDHHHHSHGGHAHHHHLPGGDAHEHAHAPHLDAHADAHAPHAPAPDDHGHAGGGAVHAHDHDPAHRHTPGEHDHPAQAHAHPGHAHGHAPRDHEHAHGHTHEHAHGHHAHGHGHGHAHDHGPVSLRALVALGVSGGIIPCPAALVVLLSALSMHRVGFGLILIVAFSVGLAAVLVAIGVLVVHAGRLMSRFREDGPWITRWLPLTSSAVMTLLGIGIAVQALGAWIP